MNLVDISHAFRRSEGNSIDVQIYRDDAVIEHASREVCTFVCDVMYRMGIRTYNDLLAQRIATQMLEQLSDHERWAKYLESTAPQMEQEMITLLGIADTEP